MFNIDHLFIINHTEIFHNLFVSLVYNRIYKLNYKQYGKEIKDDLKAQNYVNDETGKHPHVGTQECQITDCEAKKCPTVCNEPTIFYINGHFTHNPPKDKISYHIANEDIKGDPKAQYFVPVNKNIEMTKKEKENYIKEDSKTQAYVNKYKDNFEDKNE